MKRSVPNLRDDEAAAYAAPYPDARYKAGVRAFPKLGADPARHGGRRAGPPRARLVEHRLERPDLHRGRPARPGVLGSPAMAHLRKHIRNAPWPFELPDAGHFVQEAGDVVARAALDAFGSAQDRAGLPPLGS